MARIPYVDPRTASDEVRSILERLPVQLNIFRIMAHAETNILPMLRLGESVLGKQKLDAKLREMAILRTARLSGAEYEWVQHVAVGKAAGMTEAQIEALWRDDCEAPCFDATERLVLLFCTEVVRDVGASEEAFRAMAECFSAREMVELVIAAGFYMAIARLLRTFAVDPDPPSGKKLMEAVR